MGQDLSGAHIVGGDVTYNFLGYDADTTVANYRLRFTIYRDNLGGGAEFDPGSLAFFGVFRRNNTGGWTYIRQVTNVNPSNPLVIQAEDDPCVEEPIGTVGVEQAFYQFNLALPITGEDYMIAYQRCCRNGTISNLVNPGDTGAAFDIIITHEAQVSGNSSPVFNDFPPIFICAGFPLTVDQSATDPDGDLLQYTFCSPFTAGGTLDANSNGNTPAGCCDCVRPSPTICGPPFDNVVFNPPYSMSQPLGGSPVVSIDPLTGLITGVPQATGQFVVGVCVEEFRNGVSIGKVRRDFQFNVLNCNKEVNAGVQSEEIIETPDSRTFVINACGDSTLQIQNISTDERFIQTYHWEFYEEGQLFNEITGSAGNGDANITFPGLGRYTGLLIANKGIDCADTAAFNINIFPGLDAGYEFDYDTCVAGPVIFDDLSETEGNNNLVGWSWQFGDGEFSDEVNPQHIYTTPGKKEVVLTVEDNNECQDSLVQIVEYFPSPRTIIVEPSNFIGCTPSTIKLENLSTPIDSTYDITWDLGDGTFSNEISPEHTYEEAGVYSLSLDIISPIGCLIARRYESFIRIEESPVANFDCFPEQPTVFNKTVNFTDRTDKAGAWLWDFGGVGSSFVQNPTYTFPDTGIYNVMLTAYHPVTNCPDTISKVIDVIPTVEFHFPNAFTPNDDSSNDKFLGNGFYEGLRDFEISIWNRWGQQVFSSQDPREGWNGQEFNSGKAAPQGVYVFKSSYKDPRGKSFMQEGHVTLLR